MIEEISNDYPAWLVVVAIVVLYLIAYGGIIFLPFWRWNKEELSKETKNRWKEAKKRYGRA